MKVLRLSGLAILAVACSTGAPVSSGSASPQPSTGSPEATGTAATQPSLVPGSTPPAHTSAPGTSTPVASPSAGVSPGVTPGVVLGPVFTGDLADAFPPLVAGEQVQVFGPVPASEAENLDESTRNLIDQLAVDPTAAEVAFASGQSVIIFALRFPGLDSATLDSSYLAIQEAASGTSNFRVVSVAGRNVRAFDNLIGTTYAWVNGDILFTVYGTEQGAQQAIAAMPLPTVPLTVGGEVIADAIVDLVIDSGPHAGAYHGETSSGGCSRNALGDNQFGLQYSNDAAPDGFTSLQLIVRDASAAEAGSTNDFVTTVQIGPMFEGTSYNVDPSNDDGTGTVEIDSTGTDIATVVIDGETADGVSFTARVTCNVIFGMGG